MTTNVGLTRRLSVCAGLLCLLAVLAVGCGTMSSGGGGGGGRDDEPVDTDQDGLSDAEELALGTNPALADSDGDGLSDGEEVAGGTSPQARDSDGDGVDDDEDPAPTVPGETDGEPGDESDGDQVDGDGDNPEDEVPDDTDDGMVDEIEPNDTFAEATPAGLGEAESLTLVGTIASRRDVDVFDLGTLSPGDRLTVEVTQANSAFDSLVSVFDEEGELFVWNDDRDLDTLELNSFAEEVIRHESSSYFLAVTHSTFSTFSIRPSNYAVQVDIQRGGEVPAAEGQIVYLDFAGGAVEDPFLGDVELVPFDAADIDAAYDGQTGVVKSGIIATVEQNFEDFDLTVLHSDAAARPEEGTYSTIYFGGFSEDAYGIADDVDSYNSNPADNAIIYTESFTPDQFSESISAAELGVAIGNIASHEMGHLLGLHHVVDPEALMDTVSPADAFLEDQEFTTAELYEDVFPLGVQDAFQLLSEILGLL